MNISSHIHDRLIRLKVIPNSKETKLIEDGDELKIYLKAVPDKNKANLELIRFFKKELGLRVLIQNGAKSREKILEII
jgi:uncharacterized protein (TIGR00251 family)